MASPLEEMTKLLAGFATGNNSKSTLQSLKTIIISIPAADLREYVPKIDIDRLFTCFSTTDREQVELTCDILTHILRCYEPGQSLTKYRELYVEGLSHPQHLVKEFVLCQLQIAANDSNSACLLTSNVELVLSCLGLVASEDLGIASKAMKVLIALTGHEEAGSIFLKPKIVEEMQQIGTKNDTVRYRIYEIIVALCTISEQKLSVIHDAQLIQLLIEEASKNDILVQLNSLELLRTLATVQHGREYLNKEHVIEKLINQLGSDVSDPMAGLIVPGLLKFFGTYAHFQPSFLDQCPIFTETLFNLLEDSDLALVIVSMETISFIATRIEGKTILHRQGNRMDKAMSRIGLLLNHANSDVRLKALHSVAELIQIPYTQQSDVPDDLLKKVEHWFNNLGKQPLSLILNVLKQPFKDLRFEALNIFLQLCSQPWAQKLMSQQAGFIEFILDRQAEPDKECIERKFDIVKTISESATSSEIFPPYAMAQIRDHVREGPWFIRAQANVAFESGP